MKNKIGNLILSFALGMVLMFFIKTPEIVEVQIPVKIEVPVPVVEVKFDTVYLPKPIPVKGDVVIDSTYYNEYIKLKDDVTKDSLFRAAIEIKEYTKFVEDDTLRIDLYAKVRGDLLQYQIGYKTKPRIIEVDTVLTVDLPIQKNSLTLYLENGISTRQTKWEELARNNVYKLGVDYTSSKNWTYGTSFDTDERLWFKIGKTFKW